ncbi:helix-turn-helix domain-containing protein [Pseudoalteromonas viridis]|uniref:Helix-turn-helix transcriptional regulator n=1 Tax=Pseudoalteromonas viridis TaxID=339617 RepID=A0ABX7V550_9GAMM|nr:helix-turn-helix transcriptional regulator [Pseudoalteromonas viridis]QTL34355.1 helix-turn-helix transcriptional regulator [Pseudoalteromonas viridis]
MGGVTGVAKSDKDLSANNNYQLLACAHLLGVYFHQNFLKKYPQGKSITLTTREREVLLWAAEGKTDEVVAAILNISNNTVRFHWKNIFTKLDTNGRAYAVARALRLGLICPARIDPLPTKSGSY